MDGNLLYLLISPVAAGAASLLLVPWGRRLARRFRVLAHPDTLRRFHPQPVPLLGGVAVCCALTTGLAAALLFDPFQPPNLLRLCQVLIPLAALACSCGAIDDCCTLRSRAKLLLQFLIALLVVASGLSLRSIVVCGARVELGWWGAPLTIAWILGCINALNLIDGLDGLASAVGLFTAAMLGLVAANMGNMHVAVAAAALGATLAGFLVFNRPPASVFLGDAGSTLLGLSLGVLGLQGCVTRAGDWSVTAAAVLMAVPAFDVFMAVLRRGLSGRPLAMGDREHIHHCLLARGLGAWQVLGVISGLCLTTGVAALAATMLHSDPLAWIITAMLIALMVRMRIFGHREFSLLRQFLRRHPERIVQPFFLRNPSPADRIESGYSAESPRAENKFAAAGPCPGEAGADAPIAGHGKAA